MKLGPYIYSYYNWKYALKAAIIHAENFGGRYGVRKVGNLWCVGKVLD
jgi:hypothetical protein